MRRGLAAACIALLLPVGQATAAEAIVSYPSVRIVDRMLTDIAGNAVRFKGGVIGSGPAIISFTYTGCTSACPVSDLVMNAIEAALENSRRSGPRLITLTIDPLNDTRDQLAARADAIGSGPKRQWLTGDYQAVYAVLDGLGMRFGILDDHQAFFLVVSSAGTRFARVPLETADPESLLRLSDQLK